MTEPVLGPEELAPILVMSIVWFVRNRLVDSLAVSYSVLFAMGVLTSSAA